MATLIVGIDPGPVKSAVAIYDPVARQVRLSAAEEPNAAVLELLWRLEPGSYMVVVERIEALGMAVGNEVMDTGWWAGRFHQAATDAGHLTVRLSRKRVKVHLCGVAKAKEPEVNTALRDLFGGTACKGTKDRPGPCYGVTSHAWAALALAVTYAAEPTSAVADA